MKLFNSVVHEKETTIKSKTVILYEQVIGDVIRQVVKKTETERKEIFIVRNICKKEVADSSAT